MLKKRFTTQQWKMLLIAFWLFSFTSHAQDLSLNRIPDRLPTAYPSQGEKKQSLKSALQKLEKIYGVRFNYAAKLVDDKYVGEAEKLEGADNIDQSLKTLLLPLGLKYEKLSDELIFITPDDDNKFKKIKRQKVNDTQNTGSFYFNKSAIKVSQVIRVAILFRIFGEILQIVST